MKKKTWILVRGRAVVSGILAAAALFALAACAPVTGPEVSGPPQGKGLVNIKLGIDGDPGPARTLVPNLDASVFSSYTLVFTPTSGAPVSLENRTSLAAITLKAGTYTLVLTAYAGAGDGKKAAATGTVPGIVVIEGTTTTKEVPLVFKPEAGDGTLSFTVRRPADYTLSDAQFVLAPLHSGGTAYGTDWLQVMYTGEKKASHTAAQTLASGYYLATVTLSTSGKRAARADIVHIGAGQTTALDWTFETKDFATTVTVVITGVTIKNADGNPVSAISLARGTANYQFSAEPQGDHAEGTGVTWGISGASGTTAIGTDGKLSIDAAAAAGSSFTVTATSKADSTKSGSVTVTVTDVLTALPVPQSVSLSAQGVATWTAPTDETNVARYWARLYKDGATTEDGAREVAKGAAYSVDFLAAMREAGPGSYTVKVKAAGNGTYGESPEAVSGSQTVTQKTAVTHVWWFEPKKARWVNVDGDSSYTVQLYKGGSPAGEPVPVSRSAEANPGYPNETVTTHDFSSAITVPGSYTFGVVTKGDVYLALDAAEKKLEDANAYKHDVQLAIPSGLGWSGNTAQWNAVANATGYSVQLYKDGSASGAAVSATGTSHAGFAVSAPGLYTFTVKALGTGEAGTGSYLDSEVADSADTAGGAGKLGDGGAATITLTPSNKSGTLIVTGGGTSMPKSGSLDISVSGGGFSSFVWIVDGLAKTGATSASITLNGTDYSLGGHSVTVYALDEAGVPWSPEAPVSFTVTVTP